MATSEDKLRIANRRLQDAADQLERERDEALEALAECMGQLVTLANETYWTLHSMPPLNGGSLPRNLDAGMIAKDIIDGNRVERTRAVLGKGTL